MLYTFLMLKEKEEVAYYMKRVYERGLTTSLGGNISLRSGSVMAITPSSLDKANLRADDIALVDIESGENLTPHLKLSIEFEMHRKIYLKRDSAKAVIHAHSPFSSLFSSAKEEILCDIIQESYYQLKSVKKSIYAVMGSSELAEAVSNDARDSNAILIRNHGVLTVSDKSLLDALERLECLENAAKMTLMAKTVNLSRLTESEKAEIDRL